LVVFFLHFSSSYPPLSQGGGNTSSVKPKPKPRGSDADVVGAAYTQRHPTPRRATDTIVDDEETDYQPAQKRQHQKLKYKDFGGTNHNTADQSASPSPRPSPSSQSPALQRSVTVAAPTADVVYGEWDASSSSSTATVTVEDKQRNRKMLVYEPDSIESMSDKEEEDNIKSNEHSYGDGDDDDEEVHVLAPVNLKKRKEMVAVTRIGEEEDDNEDEGIVLMAKRPKPSPPPASSSYSGGRATNDVRSSVAFGSSPSPSSRVRTPAIKSDAASKITSTAPRSAATTTTTTNDRSRSTISRTQLWPGGIVTVQVRKGDITEEDVDVVVNAANSALLHGGGVAGAISRRGGPSIQKESYAWVRKHGEVGVGGVAVTSAGRLAARTYVIHAVGPVYVDGNHNEEPELYDAFYNSLVKANELGCSSISIPAISSGIFGFPKNEVARIAFDAVAHFVNKYGERSRLREIRFTNFDNPTVAVFVSEFDSRFGVGGAE
jgi:putative ATPase